MNNGRVNLALSGLPAVSATATVLIGYRPAASIVAGALVLPHASTAVMREQG